MTREQLQHYFESLPPEVKQRLAERVSTFKAYLAKAGTVRAKVSSEFPNVDPRVATFVSLAIARFL